MPETLPEDLLALRRRVEGLIAELEELEPASSDGLSESSEPASAPERKELAERVRRRSRELGLFGLTQPVELGGSGAGPLALTVVREALAASNLRLAEHVLGPEPGPLEAAEGELRGRYLEPLLRGELRGAFAFTEPPGAEQPTTARVDGEELVIDGRKSYVTGGAAADFFTVFVGVKSERTGDGNGERAGAALVIVDRDTPGVEVEREFRSLDGSDHLSLRFCDVRVPASRVIGKLGEGVPRARRNISTVRLQVAAQASGWSQWSLAYLGERLRAPHRSGRPLGEREGVRLRYAELRIVTYAARSMLYRTARLAETEGEVRNEIAATKVFVTETAGRVIDGALQLVGGQGLIEGHPLARLYRQVRALRLAEGASDVLRLEVARGDLEYGAGRL